MSEGQDKKWATCPACGREMVPGGGCDRFDYIVDGKVYEPVRHQDDEGHNCHDCNVAVGQYHHPGCDWERCAHCGGQLITEELLEMGVPGSDEQGDSQ